MAVDLLRRHLARHDMPTAPDPRRGRACDTCHANKTKCDGGKKCTLCLKRGINCTYKHASKSSSGSKSPTDNAPELRAKRPTPNSTGSQDAVPSITLNVTPGPPQISPIDEVKAGFKRIANHIQSGEIPIGEDTPVPPLDQKWLEKNSKDYFGRFHDTWPLLHGPSYVGNENSLLLMATVAMISCWLKSSDEFGEVVLQLHEAFMNASSEWISDPRSRNGLDSRWPMETYQAIVLNIIFAFYHGNERLAAKASLLRGTLVVALREIDFFNSDNAAEQQRVHYPGTFVPWLMTIEDRWKRLIIYLFKIDMYLSSARFQAPTLFREEIDLTLPSTYSLWNAYGLDVFFRRITEQPTERSNSKLSEIIANPNTPVKSLLLFEDIHLALCGLLPAIWNRSQIARRSTEAGRPTHNSTSSLAWQLETWKADVDRLSHQCFQNFHSVEAGELPFAAYIGDYVEEPSRARAAAMTNIKFLVSDCMMTYHLQGLQLYADTRTINSVAKASTVSSTHESSVRPRLQKLHTQINLWAKSLEGRRALLHALAVLRQCETDLESNEPQTQFADPVACLAISTSALVVWAWLLFSEAACSCVPSINHINIGVDPQDLNNTARLENWLQADGTAALIISSTASPTDMPKLTLYRANGACSLVPHALLRHFKIPFDAVLIKGGPNGAEAADGSFTNAQYRSIHPRGYVPALAVDNEVITEMPAILTFIASLIPNENLLGATPIQRAKVLEWLVVLSGTLHGIGYGPVLRPGRFSDDTAHHDAIKAKGVGVVRECFQRIEDQLKGSEFMVGQALTIVDFNIYVFARWAQRADIDVETEYPHYFEHLQRTEKLHGVREAVEAEDLKLEFN
ncbi:hypothetical protein KAF25_007054 [Fusarium avenaceum]|uniref:Zn(2)-C6 fungal-type domain-containing protein n=1 Tax=Fusarium avenaceum TaxID=40199 RepID=A0A9P7GXK5_9HYPO|nr:hypothetical protein KAF25_007054 [Fusarium avenaceum]